MSPRSAVQRFVPIAALLAAAVAASSLPGCGSGDAEVPAPADLSAGPILQWTDLDLAFDFPLSLETTSDGRVVAVGGMADGSFAARVTDDGEAWTALPLPEGIAPLSVDAYRDRWVLIGAPPGIHNNDADIFGQVFFTDDHGATWAEATLIWPADERLPEYATRSTRVVEALTSGDQMVVAVLTYSGFDLGSLLADRGRIPDGEFMAYWEPDEESLTVWFRDFGPTDGRPDETEITLTYAELGLSPVQVEIVQNVESDARIHLFAGDEATLGWVAAFGGSDATGRWTDEGFVLLLDDWSHVSPRPRVPKGPPWEGVILIVTRDDPSRLSSADGHNWRADPLSQYADSSHRESSVVDAAGTVWSTWRASDGRWTSIRADGDDGSPQETSRFTGIGHIEPLAIGEAGLAAVAWPHIPDQWSFTYEGRIVKEGYELRYDEPRGGLTLLDLGADTLVYEFASRSSGVPEGTRQQGDGQSYSLTFEDPETHDRLVTFTAADLEPVLGRCWWTSEKPGVFRESAGEREWAWAPARIPEFLWWVGWSANGVNWGWQTVPDAFDLCEAGTDISLAVGSDFVIALAHKFDPPPSISSETGEEREAPTSGVHHWFIARVP